MLNQLDDNPKSTTMAGKRNWLKIIFLSIAVITTVLAVVAGVVIGSVWMFDVFGGREDYDPTASGPKIETTTNADANDEENPGTNDDSKPPKDIRNSITDLFLEHPIEEAEHPLDPALMVARKGLEYLQENVQDYTAKVAKREWAAGKLQNTQIFECKIRQRSPEDAKEEIPLSFYLKFVSPRSVAGREVIWVEGRNDGKLVAHDGGVLGIIRVNLEPNSRLAMLGNRYPITELGIETLLIRMIEKGERARKLGKENCVVTVDRSITINKHKATLVTLTHPKQSDEYEFYKAKIYIDDELNLLVGYEGYLWPETEGGKEKLIERYFYTNIEINQGLSDSDFDPDNPDYDFP